jgi:hypothetical protein
MTITTPLHAEHQLDQLAGQFAHWRQTRTHPYGRIPHILWEQAVALTAALPPSRVAQQVRVRLADLKKQMAARQEATAAVSPLPLGFLEVPSAPSWHRSTAGSPRDLTPPISRRPRSCWKRWRNPVRAATALRAAPGVPPAPSARRQPAVPGPQTP